MSAGPLAQSPDVVAPTMELSAEARQGAPWEPQSRDRSQPCPAIVESTGTITLCRKTASRTCKWLKEEKVETGDQAGTVVGRKERSG